MRIAYLDPVPEAAGLPLFLNELKKYAGKGTEVSYHTLSVGSDNYEYEVFEAYMMPHILNKVRELEEEQPAEPVEGTVDGLTEEQTEETVLLEEKKNENENK